MRTAIQHGLSIWDRGHLPADEFEDRLRALDVIREAHNCVAILGLDDAASPGLAAYATNYRGGPAMLVCARDGASILFAGFGGGRDLPYIKTICCADDVRSYHTAISSIAATLQGIGCAEGRIGVIGAREVLPLPQLSKLNLELSHYEMIDLDQRFEDLRRNKRPREISAIRSGAAILQRARAVFEDRLVRGSSLHHSLVEAERAILVDGARDVRILVAAPDGSLRPWPPLVAHGADTWADGWATVYFAAEYLGYWSDLGFSVNRDGRVISKTATTLVDLITDLLLPGSTFEDVIAASRVRFSTALDDCTVEISGTGICDLEAPRLSMDAAAHVLEGDVIGVRVKAREESSMTLATSCVLVGPRTTRRLDCASHTTHFAVANSLEAGTEESEER